MLIYETVVALLWWPALNSEIAVKLLGASTRSLFGRKILESDRTTTNSRQNMREMKQFHTIEEKF